MKTQVKEQQADDTPMKTEPMIDLKEFMKSVKAHYGKDSIHVKVLKQIYDQVKVPVYLVEVA